MITSDYVFLGMGVALGLALYFFLSMIFSRRKSKDKLNKEISGARAKLRDLHKKYQEEFFEANKKVDEYLEALEK